MQSTSNQSPKVSTTWQTMSRLFLCAMTRTDLWHTLMGSRRVKVANSMTGSHQELRSEVARLMKDAVAASEEEPAQPFVVRKPPRVVQPALGRR